MSYEPRLIIRKALLDKNKEVFEEEQYNKNEDVAKVAKFLLEVNEYDTIKFDELELVLCYPELSGFNKRVRTKLEELNIDFRIDW
jgi:hypothetical protein